MINFRFHLASLVAVFLALGLGILVGSSVVDRAIVDRLDREIDDVRRESSARREQISTLEARIDSLEAYVSESAPYAVESRLAEVPVAVLAERGVDGDVVEAALDALRAAGADVPGILWLEETWRLDDIEDVRALKDATGVTGSKVAARASALDAVATRLAEPLSESGGDERDDVLAALREAGFVGFDGDDAALGAFPVRGARALVVTGGGSALVDESVASAAARSFSEAGVPTVLAEVARADGDSVRGAVLTSVREHDGLSSEISTVDDLDLVQGRVAAVLALEDLADGTVGHYGYGEGADRALPDPRA
jgi:hypothetical protein